MMFTHANDFKNYVAERNPHQPEFLQAVTEVVDSIWPFLEKNPKYLEQSLLERLVEPERVISFRVNWMTDAGAVMVNRGYRVQHNSSIGPYKGGLRFHPSVNLSILKFLAFEQTLKNSLTTLPMGGAKGGTDFDPKGKSNLEIMRFCQSFASELFRHIGSDTDVPAGDIGVGDREIGFLVGMNKKLSNKTDCVITGKGLEYGGSHIRPEATGYGLIYFVQEMLAQTNRSFENLKVAISGSGNVAQYAIDKAMQLGAKVITCSDSTGTVIDEFGFTKEKLEVLLRIKNQSYGRIKEYADKVGATFFPNIKPWAVPVDIALPCATQNELTKEDAKVLIKNRVICVAEGANMPCTQEAVSLFHNSRVLFAPGKASNAGGVATSGLEMSQQAMRLYWPKEKVDDQLHSIMQSIHQACKSYGQSSSDYINYVNGANIAGFVKVANAMLSQGII